MAILGRWTGGAKTQGNLPESWTAPANLFDTQQRNDGSAYSFAASTSTLTLPSSNLSTGYLVIAYFKYVDTSNGRFNPQGRFIQSSGTGNFVSGATGGFNRDNSEDTSYVRTWAFIDTPSASATIQFQWKADADDATGGTSSSAFEVIPFSYMNIGMYSSTDSSLYGGTTPNQITGWTDVYESDPANVELLSNQVRLKAFAKKYLCFGSYFFEGRGGRTQRWGGFRVGGTKIDYAKAYAYYRNTSNDESGEMFSWPIVTGLAIETVDMFCYRGDGVGAGQGGADADGSTPTVGSHAMVVIELNDSAELFSTIDDTGGIDLNVTGPVDQVLCRTTGIVENDAASFTRASDTAMNAEKAMDALLGANISAAQEVVATTSRWTAAARFTVNGTEDNDTESGDYARNNQGTIDTFGWSANLLSYVSLSQNDDIGVSVQELAGGEDGGQFEVQPNWGGFWGINLDTLEDAGGVTLTVNDSSHTHTAENPTLTHSYSLTAQESTHSHIAESPVLDSSYTLSSNESLHSHVAETPTITHSYALSTNESLHAHTADNVVLEIGVTLSVSDSTHGHAAENAVLSHAYSLVVNDAIHGHTADSTSLSHSYDLVANETIHGHTIESPVISSSYALVAQESTHTHLAENIVLASSYGLIPDESLHGHIADNVTLSFGTSLTVQDANHFHSAETPTISHEYSLVSNETTHGHTSENVTLSSSINLSVNDSAHSHTVESPTISHAYSLASQESIHSHEADNVVLITTGPTLSPNDSEHTHVSDNVSLSHSYQLAAESILHGHSADFVALNISLVVSQAIHAHTALEPVLSHGYVLITADTIHNHLADNVEGVTEETVSENEILALYSPITTAISLESALTQNIVLQSSITKIVSLESGITDTVTLQSDVRQDLTIESGV